DFTPYGKTMKKLQDKLLKNYDNTISPYSTKFSNQTWNAGGSLANVTMMRSRLLNVKERERQFSTATGVLLEWFGPRLEWNPDQFLDINHLYVRNSRVWMPEFAPCE
ncbi:hypothetical protein PFISCL1PPCAC_1667, partial [Pristionchus fissidentatus]